MFDEYNTDLPEIQANDEFWSWLYRRYGAFTFYELTTAQKELALQEYKRIFARRGMKVTWTRQTRVPFNPNYPQFNLTVSIG